MPLSSFRVGSVRSLLLKSRNRKRRSPNSNYCACTISGTDTDMTMTTTVGVAARETDDDLSSKRKRSRHLHSHPPSLEISATFESASSSPISSSPSPSASSSSLSCQALATLTNDPSIANNSSTKAVTVNTYRSTNSSNEYYAAAISSARSRLRAAQRMSLHSEQNLLRAKEECERCKLEVQNAMALVDAVETKWGVINIENDDDNDATRHSLQTLSTTGASSWNEQTRDLTSDDEDEVADTVQLIQVRIAGESIVHGRYHRHHPSTYNGTRTNNAMSTQHSSPVQYYIHNEGPFLIQNVMYDVCIFQRGGYGDKIRWCIGLVPCEFCNCHRNGLAPCYDTNSIDCMGSNDKENNEDGCAAHVQPNQEPQRRHHDRGRNFASAYIYYWMEVDSKDEIACIFSKTSTSESELSEPSWCVCHGIRPLPVVEDVTERRDTTRRWWQVWK